MALCPECGLRAVPLVASAFIKWPGLSRAFVWAAAPTVACATVCFVLLAIGPDDFPELLTLTFYVGVLAALIAPFSVGLLRDHDGGLTDSDRSLFIGAALILNAFIGGAFVALGFWWATRNIPGAW